MTIFCLLSVRSGRSCEAPALPKVNGDGPSCRERHMYDEPKKVSLQTMADLSRKRPKRQEGATVKNMCCIKNLHLGVHEHNWLFLPLNKRQFQLTPALLHLVSNNPAKSQTTSPLFFFLFLDEYAMQNVLSCNHRMFSFLCRGSKSRHLFQLLCSGRRGASAALCGGHRESCAEMKRRRKRFRTS